MLRAETPNTPVEIPAPLRSPPPRDLAQGLAFVRHLTRGYRLNAWLGLLLPTGVLGVSGLWLWSQGRIGVLFEAVLCPMLCVVGIIGVPMWLWAWSNIRDARRLYRDGLVVPATLVEARGGRGRVLWVVVRFTLATGEPRTMRTSVFDTEAALRSAEALAVLIDPNDPRVAVLVTPSQRYAVGEMRQPSA